MNTHYTKVNLSRIENIVIIGLLIISSLAKMFSKVVCCKCIEIRLQVVKGLVAINKMKTCVDRTK